jgi:polyhydroxybutyrate depolymerase
MHLLVHLNRRRECLTRMSGKYLNSIFLLIILILALIQGCRRVSMEELNQTATPVPGITQQPITTELPVPTKQQTIYEAGDHALSMFYDGVERTYVVHIPPGVDGSEPVPLVLAYHGLGLDAGEMMRISGLNTQSDASGFIVVYPEGTGKVTSWNGGHCCGEAAQKDVDDVGFVRALIEELSTTLPIDPKQIHATGFSNGSIFTYRLACELSDVIASFGPVSATPAELDLQECAPSRPVPIIYFHGTADDANPYYGGELPSGFYFLSVSTTLQYWVDFNHCLTGPQITESGSIRHEVYSSCDAGTSVELFTIEGGKHAWPGGEAVSARMGEPTMEISASSLLWEFFLSHPMP